MSVRGGTRPPKYRRAKSVAKSCATCVAFVEKTDMCKMFNYKVEAEYTCRDWEPRRK